jgi:tRNA dimethylallyltransferase
VAQRCVGTERFTVTPCVAIVGPTAAGKSALALAVAEELDGEVVNGDSMQLYQGMDIGTAKVTKAERVGVPHHLLDIWPVTRTATLSEYQSLALVEVERLKDRGRVPLLTGGSGMYMQAVVDTWTIPGTNPLVRTRLEAELDAEGVQSLHARLATVDRVAAATISPTDARRVVRALEVVELEGAFAARLPERLPNQEWTIIGLEVPREVLNERIAQRVNLMWEQGFVAEVESLVTKGLRAGKTASRALGYAQILRFLSGECTEQEAKAETVTATRKFARRQESWFRRDERVSWLPFDSPDLLNSARSLVQTQR